MPSAVIGGEGGYWGLCEL